MTETTAPTLPDRPPHSAQLAPQPVTAYATAQKAWLYRPVMRVFYLNRSQELGWQLRPADVQARLSRTFGLDVSDDELQAALTYLEEHDALRSDADFAEAEDVREFRRAKRIYDITPKAEEFEKALERIDNLVRQAGSLQATRLPTIRDTLCRLAVELAEPDPDRVRLRSALQELKHETTELREGATDFMVDLGRLLSGGENVDEDQFARFKLSLLDHLQGFQQQLKTHSDAIVDAIYDVEAAGVTRMCAMVAELDPAPPLRDDTDDEQRRAVKTQMRVAEWNGARSWFIGDSYQPAFWSLLDAKVTDAVVTIIRIAERMQSRLGRPLDRANAWEELAVRLGQADADDDARRWFAAAVGMVHPRHFAARDPEPGSLANPGSTPWLTAPPAPVAAHLRRPGGRRPGAGAPSRIPDTEEVKDRMRERRRLEREQLDAIRRRFCADRPLRLSDLHTLSTVEFKHLLAWVGRAFEHSAAADGSRSATSDDGDLQITLRPPETPSARTTITTPDGRLTCGDYTLEVRQL